MTTKFCVVGFPIEHSLSPALHGAAYRELGLDFSYHRHSVASGSLESFLSKNEFAGVSVTMPLKREAFEIASFKDANSEITGVSNTLVRFAEGWRASNTDVYGIKQALLPVPTPERTVILGSGATARSALLALSELFPETTVTVAGRNQEKTNEIISFAESLSLSAGVEEISASLLVASDLVVSLVPAGSFPSVWDEVSRADVGLGWLFDVTYNPWPSRPAMAWESSRVISGIEMLIWQAIEQVRLFSPGAGEKVEINSEVLYSVMKDAVSAK